MTLFIKLLIAHLIADFYAQPGHWVAEKESLRFRSPRLVLHCGIHGVLAWMAAWDLAFWPFAIVIAVTHWLIDVAKVVFQRPATRTAWFFADQALHVTVLAAISATLVHGWRPDVVTGDAFWVMLAALIFLTHPASVMIRTAISHWTPDTLRTVSGSLPDAGKFIGYLERFLVFLFILHGRWEAVGFLLAAKSVFRFGDLREAHDRKLTEYVLIGTMLSFALALLTGLASLRVLEAIAVNSR